MTIVKKKKGDDKSTYKQCKVCLKVLPKKDICNNHVTCPNLTGTMYIMDF